MDEIVGGWIVICESTGYGKESSGIASLTERMESMEFYTEFFCTLGMMNDLEDERLATNGIDCSKTARANAGGS